MGFDWNAFEDLSSLLESLRSHKERCLAAQMCPECGASIDTGVGTGRLADGIFCSLRCYADFRAVESRYINPPNRN